MLVDGLRNRLGGLAVLAGFAWSLNQPCRRSDVRASLLFIFSLAAWSSRADAQAPVSRVIPSVVFSNAAPGPLRTPGLIPPADSIDRNIRPTYWKEGALVGGLSGAAAGTVLGLVICRNSEELGKNCAGSAVAGGLIAALVLAIPGALIGGQISKGGAEE
jgi:hypothetical protein